MLLSASATATTPSLPPQLRNPYLYISVAPLPTPKYTYIPHFSAAMHLVLYLKNFRFLPWKSYIYHISPLTTPISLRSSYIWKIATIVNRHGSEKWHYWGVERNNEVSLEALNLQGQSKWSRSQVICTMYSFCHGYGHERSQDF